MDFRLSVFVSVARHLNFTRAATELYISQPAVSRHIQELEAQYKTALFERSGNKIRLTPSGKLFLKHAEAILESYKVLQQEMSLMTGDFSGELRIGASTTIAQYLLPPVITRFMTAFPDVKLSVLSGNTEQIEQVLEEGKADIGLIEGKHRKQSLRYTRFGKDELVLVTNVRNKVAEEISLDELSVLPLVLREIGSGTLEIIEEALAVQGRKLSQMNVILQLGSTESIKLFLENSPSVFAIVSVAAVAKELVNNTLKIIEIKDLELKREFAFVIKQGSHDAVKERFIQFLTGLL